MPFASLRGENLFYYVVEQEFSDSMPVVIFIHGARGSHKRYLNQIENLKHVCWPIAIDLPGHGQSTGEPPEIDC